VLKATRLLPTAAAAVLCLVLATQARAQTEDVLPPAPTKFKPVISELVEKDLEFLSRSFTIHLGAAPILDYTWLTQDEASVGQVGVQEDDLDIRSARIFARGKFFAYSKHAPRYFVAFEYRGFDSDPDHNWNFTDVTVTFPLGRIGDLSVGKLKENFSYEMVGDAANLPHVERLMSPFFVSRDIGLRWNRTAAAERMTLSLGVYNDWLTTDPTFEDSGTTVAGRVTGLPWFSSSGRRYLHLGAAFRRNGADEGKLRLKGRPESNVTDNYVDTGDIPASHADQYGLEALWNEGPVSLTAEYAESHVDSKETGDPQFRGYYVTGSWILTGEHRPYDRTVGYARRVMPKDRWGAVELIARYGLVDLTDRGVDGGYLTKWFAGVNWWANRRIRISAGCGRAALDKLGTTGHTNQYFTRLQWIY
jgi:phosphate-selective porin OprO and OprP